MIGRRIVHQRIKTIHFNLQYFQTTSKDAK